MIFLRLMIERLYLTLIKLIIIPPYLTRWSYHISNTTMVLLFFTRHWPFFFFGNWPCRLWLMSKKLLKQNKLLQTLNFCQNWKYAALAVQLKLLKTLTGRRVQTTANFKFLPKLEVHCTSSTVEALKDAYRKASTSNDHRDGNDTIKVYYPILLCSSTGHLHPSKITSSTSIA